MNLIVHFLGVIIIDSIFSLIGWAGLWLWHRNSEKVEKVKHKEYAGLFSAAGKVFMLNVIAAAGAIVMFYLVMFVLIDWIYRSFAN